MMNHCKINSLKQQLLWYFKNASAKFAENFLKKKKDKKILG
jgi:hypothetical protein